LEEVTSAAETTETTRDTVSLTTKATYIWRCDHPGCNRIFKRGSWLIKHQANVHPDPTLSAERAQSNTLSAISEDGPKVPTDRLLTPPRSIKRRRTPDEGENPVFRMKMKKEKREQSVDWDALRAPTPPGRIPTPPWRHPRAPVPPKVGSGHVDEYERNHSTSVMSLPTPPMQPYDMPKWGLRQINWEQNIPDSGRRRKSQIDPLSEQTECEETNALHRKMKIQYLINAEHS